MKQRKLTFDELDTYNNIEMLKVFDTVREYKNINDYTLRRVPLTILDFAKDESMELWKSILNEDTTGIFIIELNGAWVAGCIVVTHSPQVNMLRNDMNNSVLWDIRVESKYKRRGYGKVLFEEAVKFASKMNASRMLIETQNNNPDAIQFYEKQGAKLIEINKNYYFDLPNEDQLIFEYVIKRKPELHM